MIETEISNVLAQIRAMSAAIDRPAGTAEAAESKAGASQFGNLVKDAVSQVSEQQQTAETLANRFQAGDPNTSIAEVVVEMQKASISFQAMTEARNRIIEAYREIMSMSV
ncbi:MAG: flagellar hook-basal body complex protein FliE [Gammaproteobacteria bacterium]